VTAKHFPPNRQKQKENDKFFERLKRKLPADIDATVNRLHEEEFSRMDCTTCANCCKTTSPIFKDRDIDVLAKHFKIRPSQFTEKYLKIDEDGDYVLKSAPCPFLDAKNLCTVYSHRPQACRGYPHTDEKVFRKVIDITKKNTAVCPAVFNIVEGLKKIYL
jgi:Fe-S-cluster containining protein